MWDAGYYGKSELPPPPPPPPIPPQNLRETPLHRHPQGCLPAFKVLYRLYSVAPQICSAGKAFRVNLASGFCVLS
ncbi:hypothetical protein ACFX11_021179 [Malus domestica]